jgi:iron complex transport system permease protein
VWPALARLTTPILAIGLVALAIVAVFIGPYPMPPGDALSAVWTRLSGQVPATGSTPDTVLFFVRLPRVAAALLIGGALAAAGTAYQGLFRNPLVSPDILGVSAGAGLGAVFGIFLSLPVVGIQLLAFVVGLGTVVSCC